MLTDLEIIQRVADELPDGVWVARAPGGEFVYANRAFREIMGMEARRDVAKGEYARPYGIHTRTGELYPESQLPFVRALQLGTSVVVDDVVIHRSDGGRVFVRAHAKPVRAEDDSISHVVIAFFDITREVELERARSDAEARLARAQRMESVGSLAGGIAHDFNNLLAVIRLLGESLRRTEHDPVRLQDLHRVDEVVETAAGLTRSLLAFAGRSKGRAERVSLGTVARSILVIVERAVDRRINVRAELGDGCDIVGDASQMEQVLMNLLVNARDALPDVGTIILRTFLTTVEPSDAVRLRLEPGRHVVVEVADDGTGIDAAIRDRVFEPYFTTKTEGAVRGTGLGLATVFGVVTAHGGAVELVDNVPRGTVARVFLPAAPAAAPVARAVTNEPRSESRGLTILLVEDEPLVRNAAANGLRARGHLVHAAEDGVAGVELYRTLHASVDVVVLDMIMPRMGGRAAYRAMAAIDPDVPVVLTTGYARNDESEAILDLGARLLVPKPYGVDALLAVIAPLAEARRAARG